MQKFVSKCSTNTYCLPNHITIKDFNELERLEYRNSNFKKYGKPRLSNCDSVNRTKPC